MAASALEEEGHVGRNYVLTGPESITFCQVAEELSAVSGREIQFVDVPDAAAREAMLQAGMPEFIAEFLVMLFGELRRGVATQTTDTVRSVTGRQPCSFAEFARAYAAAFAAPISV